MTITIGFTRCLTLGTRLQLCTINFIYLFIFFYSNSLKVEGKKNNVGAKTYSSLIDVLDNIAPNLKNMLFNFIL